MTKYLNGTTVKKLSLGNNVFTMLNIWVAEQQTPLELRITIIFKRVIRHLKDPHYAF